MVHLLKKRGRKRAAHCASMHSGLCSGLVPGHPWNRLCRATGCVPPPAGEGGRRAAPQQLCSKSSAFSCSACLWTTLLPRSVRFDHCVENRENFAHASHQRNLGRLARCTQPLVERLDGRVKAHCAESCHVQRGPYIGPASPHRALAAHLAAVVVQGCHPYQFADLASVELSQLGQCGHQYGLGAVSNALETFEQLELLRKVLFEPVSNVLIKRLDLLV